MPRHQTSAASGFTIVETLIVLAIGGLILTIVFLAIPALERSSRNNQRRQDVQTILQAVSHYELESSGNMPDCGYSTSSEPSCFGTTSGTPNLLYYSKLAYYDPTSTVEVHASDLDQILTSTPGPITDNNTVKVYNHLKCDTTNIGAATTADAGYSDVVALYAIESGSSATSSQCQQL